MKSRQLTQLLLRLDLQVGVGGLGASTYPTELSLQESGPQGLAGSGRCGGLPGTLSGIEAGGIGCQVEREQVQKFDDQRKSDVLQGLVNFWLLPGHECGTYRWGRVLYLLLFNSDFLPLSLGPDRPLI